MHVTYTKEKVGLSSEQKNQSLQKTPEIHLNAVMIRPLSTILCMYRVALIFWNVSIQTPQRMEITS